jgi:hypothetical protein
MTPKAAGCESRCSSGVERVLGKDEVRGSIPLIGSLEKRKCERGNWKNEGGRRRESSIEKQVTVNNK